jgi:alpha-glucoside transport system permease protein
MDPRAIASLVVFQFMWVWNDLLVALILVGGFPQVACAAR